MPLISQSAPYLDNIAAGLASAAIGGGIARLKTQRQDGESEEQYQKRLALNTSIGATGGGAIGATLPLAFSAMSGLFPQSWTERFKEDPLKTLAAAPGELGDAAVTGVTDAVGATGLAGGTLGAVAGGQRAASRVKADAAAAAEDVKSNREALSKSQALHFGRGGGGAPTPRGQPRPETEKIMRSDKARYLLSQRALERLQSGTGKAVTRGRLMGGALGGIAGTIVDKYVSNLIE
jgi:hypothetical protein